MGLDWNPMARPRAGYEEEFEKLFGELTGRTPIKRPGLSRLFKSSTLTKAEEAVRIERFREITQAPFETLGAPRVGHDEEADEWLREKLADDASFEAAKQEMDGYYVLDLLPPCDGFPRYSHYGWYEGLDRYSFRAKFLEHAIEDIEPSLIELGYQRLTTLELVEYSSRLFEVAEHVAKMHGLDLEEDHEDEEGPEGTLDIVLVAARWCRFWGERGHGLEPWF